MGKNYLALAVPVIMLAAACEKTVNVDIPQPETAVLNVSLQEPLTKVADTDGEGTIENVQVFVFRKDGSLDAYGEALGNSVSISCTVGERDIVALANAPACTDVVDYEGLKSKFSDLKDNAPGHFVMSHSVRQNISALDNTVHITVSRLVSRVSINSITNDFTLQQYRDAEFKVVAIYLVNVAGEIKYLSDENGALWYNKLQNDASSEVSGLVYSGELDAVVAAGQSYSTPHYFYCYPNCTAEDSDAAAWSPRYTRLVVETTLDGKTYYYPVNIEDMKSNHKYEIKEMRITRIGSESPDIPVSFEDATFIIEADEWAPGTSVDVEI